MKSQKAVKLGIVLGDHAGIGPEIVFKALNKTNEDYVPILIGNEKLFEKYAHDIKLSKFNESHTELKKGNVYYLDIPAGDDISLGQVTADSGRLIYDSLCMAVEMQKKGIIDGIVMAPITKQALHMAGLHYTSEFEIFSALYSVPSVGSVVKCNNIFRSTVVGHCPFKEIINNLTVEKITDTGRELLKVMGSFMPEQECKIAVAALNPHAGEDGLFGDEESRIITPAILNLQKEGANVTNPCPADTVFLKARKGEVRGIVFLYHDQGNIAMKSTFFGDGVLIYTNVPAVLCSVGHGSALDIAGKNIADEKNIVSCIDTAIQICKNMGESNE